MITYEFTTAEAPCYIFQANKGSVLEYLEVPLRIHIPYHLTRRHGLDQLQGQIEDAMDDVVKTLNHEFS